MPPFPDAMKNQRVVIISLVAALAIAGGWLLYRPAPPTTSSPPVSTKLKPALTVTLATVQEADWPRQLAVDGNVSAWQESLIGSELGQLRITEVSAQVGDTVRRGQVLARLADDVAMAEREEARAAVSELTSYADEAKANAERAKTLREKGFYSQQANTQYLTGEQASQARLKAAHARLENAELQVSRTRVVATDDGIISARNATAGSLTQPGHELFRLIRGGRLEWQAELPAEQLAIVRPGMAARIVLNISNPRNEEIIDAKVRNIAPAIDPRTRTGLVYIELPTHAGLRAGMFVRGNIITGESKVLTLPQRAIVLRDGHTYVYTLSGQPARAQPSLVRLGARQGENVEILEGLAAGDAVVDRGARFLADGDIVQVVSATDAAPTQPRVTP